MIPLNNPTAPDRGDGNLHLEILAICLVLLSALITGCGSTTDLSSSWSSSAVAVDGSAGEWSSHLTNLKDTHVSLGIQNDQDFLYICLMSAEPQFRRQVLGLGLKVWFESESGQTFGVRYPIGMLKRRAQGSLSTDGNRDPGQRERMEQSLQDLEILGPGKEDRNLLSILQAPGISVKLGGSEGSVIYELKVPLRRSHDHPYAVGVALGSTVKLAIQTGKLEDEMRQGSETGGGMRGGRRRGGGGPPRGGLPSGGGGSGREGSGRRPEPLDFLANVRLAGTASP